jgi:uroporphyrinogen decarboxylase
LESYKFYKTSNFTKVKPDIIPINFSDQLIMNGNQRINSALKGLKPDKTPVMLHNFMMAAREYGVTMEQYRNSPIVIADAFKHSVEKYQYDGIIIDIDTATLAGAVGVKVDFPADDPARVIKGDVENLEDVSNLKPLNIENDQRIQIWLEAVRLLKEYFKDQFFIRGNCDQAPFSLASMMRSTENWMLDLMIAQEEQLKALLEYCTEAGLQFIRLMAQTGCDMVSSGDSPAGPELVSPEIYLKYAMPYEKRLADAAHQTGLPYTLHICGNTDLILEHMIETGADAFELDYKTDISKVFNVFGNKAAFIGNIDPSGVLALGTKEEVKQKTLELLSDYRGSNRFILNAGCSIPPNTPSENLKMMIETARNYNKSL